MALFQPTFITPDLRQGLGEGTVDVTGGLTVSWHINGASAMTGFQIVIYQNTAASTQIYSTGRLTTGCPAYGTGSDGTMLFFSYTVPAAALSAAGISNGNEYKLLITQWWGQSDSITQSSASVFLTRAAPALSVTAIGNGGVIDTRYYTFSGAYSQVQGDTLNWFRWQVAVASQTDAPLFDSGNISGTMDISCYYDGFFSGTQYAVRLTCQTENGVEADTGWVTFTAQYATPQVAGTLNVGCATGTDAVYVEWTGVAYIPGTASGSYTLQDGSLILPAGSSVTWNEVNQQAMRFAAPWSLVWRGTLAGVSATLVTLTQSGGNITLAYNAATATLSLNAGSAVLASRSGVSSEAVCTVILTPDTAYFRAAALSGGLYPSDTLYPSGTLYPLADDRESAGTWSYVVNYTQGAITAVTLSGAQTADYIEIIQGAASSATIQAAWQEGDYTPGLSDADYLVADFTDGLNAGNLTIGGDTIEGYALYRRQGEASILRHIADLGQNVTELYDYGAASQQGPYTYYLFPVGTSTYIAQSLVSQEVSPCFWNWTLMECEPWADGKTFTVLAEYRFRNNVSTNAISNNNSPNVLQNFTRYPTVQPAPQNYKSGTLTALIGWVYRDGSKSGYVDSINLRDAICALPLSGNTLFLKNRKGDLWRVAVSEAITMQTSDDTRQQMQTMALSWCEVGPADSVSLYAMSSAAQNSQQSGPGSGGVKRGQVKTVTPQAAAQTIRPDPGYDYLESVIVQGVPFSSVANATGFTAKIGE